MIYGENTQFFIVVNVGKQSRIIRPALISTLPNIFFDGVTFTSDSTLGYLFFCLDNNFVQGSCYLYILIKTLPNYSLPTFYSL